MFEYDIISVLDQVCFDCVDDGVAAGPIITDSELVGEAAIV